MAFARGASYEDDVEALDRGLSEKLVPSGEISLDLTDRDQGGPPPPVATDNGGLGRGESGNKQKLEEEPNGEDVAADKDGDIDCMDEDDLDDLDEELTRLEDEYPCVWRRPPFPRMWMGSTVLKPKQFKCSAEQGNVPYVMHRSKGGVECYEWVDTWDDRGLSPPQEPERQVTFMTATEWEERAPFLEEEDRRQEIENQYEAEHPPEQVDDADVQMEECDFTEDAAASGGSSPESANENLLPFLQRP